MTLNSHTIRFVPTGYGYGLATPVSVGLPTGSARRRPAVGQRLERHLDRAGRLDGAAPAAAGACSATCR